MAKSKKKKDKDSKKNKSLSKMIKPYVKDKRVLFSILGAAGLGVALVSAIRTGQLQKVVEQASEAVKNLRGSKVAPVAAAQPTTSSPAKKPTIPNT